MKKYLSSLGLLLLSGFSFGQSTKIEFIEYDLPNGMHVILHEDHSTPVAAVTLMYHVGSKNENEGRTGFAHFFEHLMFEGTENIDRHQYDKYVEKAGGTLNANTSQDRTFYYELLPSNQIEMGLWLESERLLHAKVENIGIETQREVVKEEKRQRMDNQPYGSFQENIFKRAYINHPYKWTVIGSMDDLNAAEEKDYVNFYRTFYVPHNVTLSIAGDIDVAQTKKWIEDYFGTIPNGDKLNIYRDKEFLSREKFAAKYKTEVGMLMDSKNFIGDYNSLSTEDFIKKYFPKASEKPHPIPRPTIKEGLLTKEIKDTIYDNIQLSGMFVAYRTPELNHADHYAVEMLTKILSEGKSSRIYKNVVEDQQKALQAFIFPFPLEDPGIVLTFALAQKDVDLADLQASVDAEIKKLQVELVSDNELKKIQNQIENDVISSFSSMAGIAENLAQYYTYYQGQTNLINTEIDKYLAVTPEDIKRVANTYFNPSNRVVLYYLPKK
ncbi:insulinase family protein [Putridiphycobacter roseus]|uniref:Insulinase family protein n=2 Tax=Putridiphycobacter roseus TaxID=2219161 RepID=A0A2W1NM86_9FLAO|nr:insulinase family protein [Putridiphycobacter roseus]